LPAADRDHRRALAAAPYLAAGVGAGELVRGAERLRPRDAAGRDRGLRLQAVGWREAQRDWRRRDGRAAVLRGSAVSLGPSEVPAAEARKGPVRARSEGSRGHLAGYSLNG